MSTVFIVCTLLMPINLLPCVQCIDKTFQIIQHNNVTQEFFADHHVRTILNVNALLFCSMQCILSRGMQCCKSFTYVKSQRLCYHYNEEPNSTDLIFNKSVSTYVIVKKAKPLEFKCHEYYFSQSDNVKKVWHSARKHCNDMWNGQGSLVRIESKEVCNL